MSDISRKMAEEWLGNKEDTELVNELDTFARKCMAVAIDEVLQKLSPYLIDTRWVVEIRTRLCGNEPQ